MPKLSKKEKKDVYFEKLERCFATYPKVLIVSADNVGSRQMADIRIQLRGKAIILFGKNTMMRRCLRNQLDQHPEYAVLLDLIKLNVGFVFCIEDVTKVRAIVEGVKVPAAARQGALAPIDVHIPAGPCGLDPSQTSFFQALGIATKITKGQVEINQPVHLIKKGLRVAASQAALLQKLGIKPFEYGLVVKSVYDHGSIYSVAVLDLTQDVMRQKFYDGVRNVAALSFATHYPTAASAPHHLIKCFKNIISVSLDTKFDFSQLAHVRKILANPSAFAGAPAADAAAGGKAAPAAVVEDEEEEEEMDFDLFD